MMLSPSNKAAATSLVENNPEIKTPFPDATRRRILNSIVRFFGPNAARVANPQAGGDVNSSGVIFNVSNKPTNDTVTILTAVHNLLLWAGLEYPPNNWDATVQGFVKAMAMYYGCKKDQRLADLGFDKSLTEKLALKDIASIAVPKIPGICGYQPVRAKCYYDVAVITCKDATLAAYAKNFVFGGQLDTMASEVKEIIDAGEKILDRKSYIYVQVGCGVRNEQRYTESIDDETKNLRKQQATQNIALVPADKMSDFTLHYRIAIPKNKQTVSVFNQVAQAGKKPAYTEYPGAIVLDGKQSTTTAKGDSGGPLFAIESKFRKQVYLIGVTTGGDMETTPKLAARPFLNCISTSIVPYLEG